MEVALDISKVLELAKQDEDLESHYVYQLTSGLTRIKLPLYLHYPA